jgi:hypothetical protein
MLHSIWNKSRESEDIAASNRSLMFMVSLPDGYYCCLGGEANRHSWLKALYARLFANVLDFALMKR